VPGDVVCITSIEDPRLDDYRRIPEPELIRSRGQFIAEGRLVVRRLVESSRFSVGSILVTSAALDDLADLLPQVTAPIFVVEQEAMHAVAGFNFHRGCLAVGFRQPPLPWPQIVAEARLVVALEGLSNADNMGGIFRNAAAFGADAVLLDPLSVDPLYRKAIRTSMGAALQLPFATMTDWPGDLARLRDMGFRVLALTPAGDAPSIHDIRTDGEKLALLVGHEGSGLTGAAFAQADVRARIPMPGGIDSLNVATAAAIALCEIVRRADLKVGPYAGLGRPT
jgi:tRNA G18 (ribose-2'-O)-methylase SpoU